MKKFVGMQHVMTKPDKNCDDQSYKVEQLQLSTRGVKQDYML